MQFWALFVDSLRESRDRKTFWVMLAISVIVALAMASVSFTAQGVHLGFGTWTLPEPTYDPLTPSGRSAIAALVILGPLDFFLGTVGVLLMIVATASMFPALMEHGTVDVVLSKPISRPKLFLYKYLTGLLFATIQSAVFIVLTFVVIGWRWNVWIPGYLFSVLLMTLMFSYLYCVSVFVAVRFRSTIASILITVGAWVLFATPGNVLDVYESIKGPDSSSTYRSIQTAYWVLPKTKDITSIAGRWAKAGTSLDILPRGAVESGSQQEREQMRRLDKIERDLMQKSPWPSIGSSLLFEIVLLTWSMWTFSRKDF